MIKSDPEQITRPPFSPYEEDGGVLFHKTGGIFKKMEFKKGATKASKTIESDDLTLRNIPPKILETIDVRTNGQTEFGKNTKTIFGLFE